MCITSGKGEYMAASREKILVVDSDAKRAQSLVTALQERGVEVHSAADPINAFFVARKFEPDAVVINSELADGGAMVTLKRIRGNVFTTNIPVIIATPRGGSADRAFLAACAQECIALPLSAEAIHTAAQRHILQSLDFTEAPEDVLAHPDRLAALHETALLDSAPEESFDRLTLLASRLLGVGTALVSLVDKDRQFFKSQVGLAEPWAGARQTRLSHSFCQWVVSGSEALVVENASEQPALRSNLAIKDLGVIAYAGVPLSGRGGHVIGSFCAIDSKPRAWTDEDVATLRDLSQVSEAYAVLDQAKRSTGAPASGGMTNLETSIHVAGKAIHGVTQILRRYGVRLGDAERNDLLAIIEEQSEHLVALASSSH
jgi:DNA-binding response OmpR family regulator